MKPIGVGVLGSTNGTDLQGIIDAIEKKELNATIGLVVSDQKEAFILKRAERHQIPFLCVERKNFPDKKSFNAELASQMKKSGVELVLLIGYKRILTKEFLDAFPGRVLNIHPSLLPAFAGKFGQDVHQTVLDAGVKVSGATLHFVTEEVDAGPILLQKAVEIAENETAETLKQKVQKIEQELFLKAIPLFAKET